MHRVMASCYLLLLVGGFWMVKMPDNTPLQGNAYSLHKSIGALTMAWLTWRIFILQRVWWRKYTPRLALHNWGMIQDGRGTVLTG